MSLPNPLDRYDRRWAAELKRVLDAFMGRAYVAGKDVELEAGASVVLRSPDGTRWRIKVDNAGALSTELAP